MALLTGLLLAPLAGAAGSSTVPVTATVPSKNICQFRGSTVAALPFGTLSAGGANAVVSAGLTLRCMGSAPIATFLITADDGLHAASVGRRRMVNASVSTAFLAYDLAVTPSSASVAKNVDLAITVTGTVTAAYLENVEAGSYADQVTLTLSP
ncbi:spore coat protein U domain-containing protein [Ideonella livida]|uniref:Fimbrial major subunit CsuA/B family protein n=1 Tax=Ideonella livida TaxID=2707176 RepID=A0A7C9PHT5_9BURK|nr:spore coat protein U domain-containing protein [Ideonella livida]NDY92128.1 fimbrial major subunit CsuA/B family protein [Ideonella livida]